MGHTTMGEIDFKTFNPPTNTHLPTNRKTTKKFIGKKFKKNLNSNPSEQPVTSDKVQPIRLGNSFRKYNEKDTFTKTHSHDMNKKRAFGPAKSSFAQKRFNRGK